MGFLPRMESLRGIAALTVVGYHVWGGFSDTPTTGWDAVAFHMLKGLTNGIGAVVGFFVISGFVLARSLDANPDPVRYFRNRFYRLFPAAIAVVALLTALHQWFGIRVMYEGDFSPANVLLNMLMVRTDINAVMCLSVLEIYRSARNQSGQEAHKIPRRRACACRRVSKAGPQVGLSKAKPTK